MRVLRAKFSEITRPSIDRAMATLGQVLLNIQWNVGCDCNVTDSAVKHLAIWVWGVAYE